MLTYRVGASASPAAGVAMAKYLTTETLKPEQEALARYYAGETPPLPASLVEEFAQGLNRGDLSYGEALDELVRAEMALIPRGQEVNIERIEARIGRALDTAVTRDDFAQEIAAQGGTVAELRPDLSPALAERLGISNPAWSLSESGIAHLLNGRRLDRGENSGQAHAEAHLKHCRGIRVGLETARKWRGRAERPGWQARGRHSPCDGPGKGTGAGDHLGCSPSLLDGHGRPSAPRGDARGGRCADQRQVSNGRDDRGERLPPANPFDASAGRVRGSNLLCRQVTQRCLGTSASHSRASGSPGYPQTRRRGCDGLCRTTRWLRPDRRRWKGPCGARELGWISFQHYTARPAVDIVRTDAEGRAYTDPREVPLQTADPQLHTHATVFNAVLTESGRLGSLDLDRLDGFVKEGGAVYQAAVATRARRAGIDVTLDDRTGAARLADIPTAAREMFSKRSREALSAARDLAQKRGVDWDSLNGEQQIALIKAGADTTRNAKDKRSFGGEGQRLCRVACPGRSRGVSASVCAAARRDQARTQC